jgi:hypothetical protein
VKNTSRVPVSFSLVFMMGIHKRLGKDFVLSRIRRMWDMYDTRQFVPKDTDSKRSKPKLPFLYKSIRRVV